MSQVASKEEKKSSRKPEYYLRLIKKKSTVRMRKGKEENEKQAGFFCRCIKMPK